MELLISRKIDELGRITLPSELRNKLGWETGDELALYSVDRNTMLVQLTEKASGPSCVICKKPESIVKLSNADICGACFKEIKDM